MDITILIYVVVSLIVGIALPTLFNIFKDLTVGEKERKILIDTITEVTKRIVSVATTKNKEQLILAITNIAIKELKDKNVNNFSKEEVKTIVKMIIERIDKNN